MFAWHTCSNWMAYLRRLDVKIYLIIATLGQFISFLRPESVKYTE